MLLYPPTTLANAPPGVPQAHGGQGEQLCGPLANVGRILTGGRYPTVAMGLAICTIILETFARQAWGALLGLWTKPRAVSRQSLERYCHLVTVTR